MGETDLEETTFEPRGHPRSNIYVYTNASKFKMRLRETKGVLRRGSVAFGGHKNG